MFAVDELQMAAYCTPLHLWSKSFSSHTRFWSLEDVPFLNCFLSVLNVLSAGSNFWKDRWLYFPNIIWRGCKLVSCWHWSLTAGWFCWPIFYSQWLRPYCEKNPACLIGFLWCRAGGYRSMWNLKKERDLGPVQTVYFSCIEYKKAFYSNQISIKIIRWFRRRIFHASNIIDQASRDVFAVISQTI